MSDCLRAVSQSNNLSFKYQYLPASFCIPTATRTRTYYLGSTFETWPGSAGCHLTCRLAVVAMAGHGLAWPGSCDRWLPVWLPGMASSAGVRCPALNPVTGSRSTAGFHRPAGVMIGGHTRCVRTEPRAEDPSGSPSRGPGLRQCRPGPTSRPDSTIADLQQQCLRLLAGDARADRQCGYRDCRTAVLPSYYGRPQETLHIHPA